MTLLSIAKDVADVIGLTRPASIINGTDQLSRQMLGFAKETLEELGFMDWPILERPYTFNTVVDQTDYDLPADFMREIGDSVYVSTQYNRVRGSLTPADWARQRGTYPDLGRYKFRIWGYPLKMRITPAPQTVEPVTFEYQSTARVLQADNSLKETYYDDQDVSIVPEDLMKSGLKWRMRRAKGLDYSEEFDAYEIARAQRLAQTLQMGSQAVAYRSPFYDDDIPPAGYMPENGFGA